MKRVPAFDGIRAIAISLVILCHVCARSPDLIVTRLIGQQGWYGVDIFFVLSGFLITRLLIAEQDESGQIDLPRFYVRRVFRLYPALISAVGLTLAGLIAAGLRHDVKVLFEFLPFILTYTFNFWVSIFGVPPGFLLDQIWSLCVEEHFYLIWPAALRRLKHERAVSTLIAALAIAMIIRTGAWLLLPSAASSMFIGYSTFTRMDAIIVGCIMGLMVPWVERYPFLYGGRALWLYSITSLLLIEWGVPSTYFCVFGGTVLMAAMVGAAITAIWLDAPCGVSRFLAAPPLVEIGRVSYGIYLFHIAVFAAILRVLRIHAAQSSMILLAIFALTCLLTFAISELHYRTVETRFLGLRERISYRRRSRPDVAMPLARAGSRTTA